MMQVKRLTSVVLSMIFWSIANGQGLIQVGGSVVMQEGAYLVVDGSNGHYYDSLGGKVSIVDEGYVVLPGNWTNVSGAGVFTTNNGHVSLNGGVQTIRGIDVTYFPDLSLSGSGEKILEVSALTGGGFSGGGLGGLKCNAQFLRLNGHTVEINNRLTTGITERGGGVISESNATEGYGVVQWNIRNESGNYSVPFVSRAYQPIPYGFNIQTAGVSSSDSGSLSVSTHPTDPTSAINNRDLPPGTTNTLNEYGRENAHKLVDRYWLVRNSQYTTAPTGEASYSYLDQEWDAILGSTNDLVESNLRPLRFEGASNQWSYPGTGTTSVAENRTTGTLDNFGGIWVLGDTTICPRADFIWDGNCEFSPIGFSDLSTISEGQIESYLWDFDDGDISTDTDPIHTFTPANDYNVKLVVVGPSGCPDSAQRTVTVDAKAVADFTYDDDPLVGYPVQFTQTSAHADNWLWDFGDFNGSTDENPGHTYDTEASYLVSLIANNLANCPDTIWKQIEVNQPSLFLVPTAFSPGGQDNLNRDVGLTTLQRITEYNFRVYNRWGELLFESTDIAQRWDGTYLGKPVMQGSYLYMVSFRDRTLRSHYLKGNILLVR